MKITLPHSFYSCAAHDELLRQWSENRHQEGALELDLRGVGFIDPYGIVGLTLFLNHLPPENLPVHLSIDGFPPVAGQENSVIAYLTKMGFWEEVGAKLDVPSKQLPQRPMFLEDKNVMIDVTILHSRDSVHVMLRKMGEILGALKYNPIARGHVMEVLSEIGSNVLDHAEAEYGGVVTTQTYRSRRSGTRYLVMSIGDYGLGIRNTIKNNEKFAGRLETDAQALGVAVGLGNSRFQTGGRGGGLHRVLEIARKYSGSIVIRSGEGAISFQGKTEERKIFEAPALQGTQFRMMLPESRLLTS